MRLLPDFGKNLLLLKRSLSLKRWLINAAKNKIDFIVVVL